MVLEIIGIFIAVLIGLVVLEILYVGFAPGFEVPKQPLITGKKKPDDPDAKSPSRKDVSFEVEGTSISAWLYLPGDPSAPVPCIIMGHGFGGTKDMLLERYAVRYQEAGFAVLTFDYRHFGESEGEARQLMWIPYQLEDFTAAVEYARNRKEIDPARIALWGTSAGGGYGIVIAARDKTIACVVGQCPGLDPHASGKKLLKEMGIRHFFRLFIHGQRDMIRYRFGFSPHTIPIVGKPGSLAVFTIPEAYEGYANIVPESFVNEVCARVMLRSHGFRPVEHAKNAHCPILIQICENDALVAIGTETEKELKKYADVKSYPIGHFEIYAGDNFERAVSDQLDFFRQHLL
jgi:fermentation-respiration switch protein FrsA (DUF1100 family)